MTRNDSLPRYKILLVSWGGTVREYASGLTYNDAYEICEQSGWICWICCPDGWHEWDMEIEEEDNI